MNRLDRCFTNLKFKGEKALVTFITAGDPELETTEKAVKNLELAGADIIELGMPFSDPMADGPTIQLSSERALASGTTLKAILAMVLKLRATVNIPIVLMGYLNPIHAYGYESFARDAVASGIDAVLLVDMPPEEAEQFLPLATACGLKVIFLLTPTSDNNRIKTVATLGGGFIYYVTVTGVTGARQELSQDLASKLAELKRNISLPIVAGFGISTPKQAAEVAELADGVVVGSAIVKLFEQYSGKELQEQLKNFVMNLKQALPCSKAS